MDNSPINEDEMDELEKRLLGQARNEYGGDNSAIASNNQVRSGVLARLLTAEQDEKNYRQILLLADYIDDYEADLVTAAIHEALRYGLDLAPILDWVTNRCAVNKNHGKSRVVIGVEGLTHTSISSMRYGKEGISKKNKQRMEDQL